MRVAARKFAIILWICAFIVAADIAVQIWCTPYGEASMSSFETAVAFTFLLVRHAGWLLLLGAIIWLLGDIRDRLVPVDGT